MLVIFFRIRAGVVATVRRTATERTTAERAGTVDSVGVAVLHVCPVVATVRRTAGTDAVAAERAVQRWGADVLQGAAEKNGPLNFFAVFSATVWDFNTKFYSFIY